MKVEIHVRLPAELHEWLTGEAKRLGVSVNALVSMLMAEARERKVQR